MRVVVVCCTASFILYIEHVNFNHYYNILIIYVWLVNIICVVYISYFKRPGINSNLSFLFFYTRLCLLCRFFNSLFEFEPDIKKEKKMNSFCRPFAFLLDNNYQRLIPMYTECIRIHLMIPWTVSKVLPRSVNHLGNGVGVGEQP